MDTSTRCGRFLRESCVGSYKGRGKWVHNANPQAQRMTADEIRRSVEAREYARHSNAMEGLYETPEESALLDAVARGKSPSRVRLDRTREARTSRDSVTARAAHEESVPSRRQCNLKKQTRDCARSRVCILLGRARR